MTRPKAAGLHPHPLMYAVAAGLTVVLLLVVLARSDPISTSVVLSLDDWRCSASHEEKRKSPHALGSIQFDVTTTCDQWSRR